MAPSSRSSLIYKELLLRIQQEQYKEGDKLPTETALCEEFKVSRPVIRAALEQLREGNSRLRQFCSSNKRSDTDKFRSDFRSKRSHSVHGIPNNSRTADCLSSRDQ